MIILIREHKNDRLEICTLPDQTNVDAFIEAWLKKTTYYQVRKRAPGITWCVAESDNIVDAMIEAATKI